MSNILYYLYSFFSQLDFSRGIFILFLLDKGMSTGQIGVLQTALFWSSMVAEVPAGIAADKYKRKYSVLVGLVLISLVAFAYLYVDSFYAFLLIFIFHGAGFAFVSGADSALLYDNLKSEKKENQYVSVLSKSRNIGTLALALAIYLGGVLKEISWDIVYLSFGVAMVLAAVSITFLKEKKHSKNEHEESPSVFQALKDFTRLPEGKGLISFILGMAFLEMTAAPIFIYIQKYFTDQSLDTASIGLIIAASQIFTALVYLTAKYFKGQRLSSLVLAGSILLSLLIFPFFFALPIFVGIMLFLLIEAIPNLIFIFTDNHINEGVPSHIRASFLSVQSFITSIFVGVGFLGCGFLMEHFSSSAVIGMLSLFPLIGLIILIPYFSKLGESRAY